MLIKEKAKSLFEALKGMKVKSFCPIRVGLCGLRLVLICITLRCKMKLLLVMFKVASKFPGALPSVEQANHRSKSKELFA